MKQIRSFFRLLCGRCPTHNEPLSRDHWAYAPRSHRDCFYCRPFVTDKPRYPYGLLTVLRSVLPLLLLALLATQAAAGPGLAPWHPTDPTLTPYQKLLRKGPLLAQAIRSVDHICDRVIDISLNNAPGIDYYLVTCDNGELGQARYTVGVTRSRTVVWPGEVN